MRVLVTGGAGFVGSYLVEQLIARGDSVLVHDLLHPQVHTAGPPGWLCPDAEYRFCDPRDDPSFASALEGADALVHLAAATGTGQSMHEAAAYTDTNATLTGWLCDLVVNGRARPDRMIFASSRAVYGEGPGSCPLHGRVLPELRTPSDLTSGRWDARCPTCGSDTAWLPTTELDPIRPLSVYAATKAYGEQLWAFASSASGVPAVSLRFFNLYGARQTPTNPYVGVASVFASAVVRSGPIQLFEDGSSVRDFLHVRDAAGALLAAVDARVPVRGVVNIGSGQGVTLRELAAALAAAAGTELRASTNGQTRHGDLRACVADIQRAKDLLGWRPRVPLEVGALDLVGYAATSDPAPDVEDVLSDLARRGLVMGVAQ